MTDWIRVKLSDCLARVERPVNVVQDKHYTQIGIRSHGKGVFHKEAVTGEELGNKAVYWVDPDCFVLNIVFAWEQAVGKTTSSEAGMIASHRFPMYRPKDNLVDIDYLISFFMTKRGKEVLEAASPGGAGRNRTLGQERFLNSVITLPPIAEQRKIAEILSAQDRIIELKTKLLEEKKRLKKYLCQVLLSGKRRFPSYHEPWNKVCLSSILKEKTINCKNQNLRVYSVSVDVGVVDQIEHLGRSYAARDISKYTVVEKGDVIYTKSPTGLFPFGIVKQSQMDASGAVSPLYAVYSPKSIELGYLLHTYFSYPLNTTNYLKSLIQRGPKNTMSISNSDFLKKALHLPVDKDEIARLSDLFKQIDIEIRIMANNIEQENLKKKALMQQLLTGKIRVTV